ncbi:MAG TPA: hypothetical protein VNI01_10190 [Elusimicrobiota bacterium]|nr:hypothetical protein [Elusimicrobiota bacterium]
MGRINVGPPNPSTLLVFVLAILLALAVSAAAALAAVRLLGAGLARVGRWLGDDGPPGGTG